MIQLNVVIDDATTITLDEQSSIIIYPAKSALGPTEPAILLYVKDQQVFSIDYSASLVKSEVKKADKVIVLSCPWDIEGSKAAQLFADRLSENKQSVDYLFEKQTIAANQFSAISDYQEKLLKILQVFGLALDKKVSGKKAQHRWNKSLSERPFYVSYEGAKATVVWQKRNEMLIKAGAVLKKEPPLNKDGSLGFDARFAEKLRAEHEDAIKEYQTTEDIIVKSTNEVGLLLYFGGTNGWLVLKDEEGKTLDDYSAIQ